MCGRYASSRRPEELVEEFGVLQTRIEGPLEADYNVAPTKDVYAVVERAQPEEPAQRQLRVLRWGLVPSWAKDSSIGNRMINARMETVAEKPAYRRAFAKRRCLLPADGYFEWYPTQAVDARGKARKQPYFIRPRDHATLAMAGLYEIWRDPAKAEDDATRFLWTCTVITTQATDDLGAIHDRMPLMVAREHWDRWLGATQDQDSLMEVLVPAAPGRLEAYPVSSLVSNVRNNGAELIEPLVLEGGS